MLFFFGYWTSIGMEIFKKNVVFFGYWTSIGLDFYRYGLGTSIFLANAPRKFV